MVLPLLAAAGIGAGIHYGMSGSNSEPDRNLARYLGLPGGFTARKYGKATLLQQLLEQLGAPTGLEGMYGDDFQTRAVGSTLERTAAPFEEAGRQFASNYLRGASSPGALMEGRRRLATSQASTTGSALNDLLMQLEEARAGLVERGEGIRTSRQSLLANFLNALMSHQFQRDALRSQRSMNRENNLQSGTNATIGALI